jgi:hypothetical protein
VPLPRVAIIRPWHAGSTVIGSGGGGLARRAITATTVVVVPAVVATTMTAIVVLVVVLVPVATVSAVATAGWARWCGGWWPGCWGLDIGVECCWGNRRIHTIYVDLLQ